MLSRVRDWFREAELLAGLVLALAVVTIAVAERLAGARKIVRVIETAPKGFVVVEWLVLVGGVGLGIAVLLIARNQVTTRRKWLVVAGAAAIGAWGLWQFLELVGAHGKLADALHLLAPCFAILALAVAGEELVGGVGAAWQRASVVRIHLIVLTVLFVLVFEFPFASDQLADVLRAWGDEAISRPAAGIAAALLLGATVRTSAARLLIPDRTRAVGTDDDSLELIGFGLAGLAVLLWWPIGLEAAAVPVAAIGVVAILSDPAAQRGAVLTDTPETRRSLRRLSATLAVLPVMTLVAGLVGAATDSLLLAGPRTGETTELVLWTVGVAMLFALLAARAPVVRDEIRTELPEPRVPGRVVFGVALGLAYFMRWLPDAAAVLLLVGTLALALRLLGESGALAIWAAWGAGLGMAGALYAEPLTAARSYGALALTMIAIALIVALLHAAASIAARRTPIGRLDRVPVVTILAVWIAVAWIWEPPVLHQARTVDTKSEPASFEDSVHDWLDAQPSGTDPLPMLLVGASGGGSKAAYWTGLVMDCVFGSGEPGEDECDGDDGAAERRRGALFLTSSVSGGSVGVHHLLRAYDKVGGSGTWLVTAFEEEALSPAVGWGLVHDLPAFMLGLHVDPSHCDVRVPCRIGGDRAAVQEAALGGTDDEALLETLPLEDEAPEPLAIFNGASEGRRVLLSRVALAPGRDCPADDEPIAGAVDGYDVLAAGRDVPQLTAAMLSARFPGVAPAGRLGRDTGPEPVSGCDEPATRAPIEIRDGGYIENSGLLTIVDLLPAIDQAVASWDGENGARVWPIVLSVDDDVPKVADEDHYRQGLFGFGESGNRTLRARHRLRGSECAFPGVSYVRISPQPHVGAQAATGWEVSKTSRRSDLVASLRSGDNAANIKKVQAALDGDPGGPPRCE